MRILALDIGQVRIGLAVSDTQEKVATPLCVLPALDVINHTKPFKRILQDWEPDKLLCGLPLTLEGKAGAQAQHTRKVALQIAKACELPVQFCDERLSSSEAKRFLREKGLNEREMRGKIDMIAASLFLQAWLDEKNSA